MTILTWPIESPPSAATGAKMYEGCSSLAWIFWIGEMGKRGKDAEPMVSVRVWDGCVGGLAGMRLSVRSPVDSGSGED
jgi:hypothetical protein